MENSLLRTEYTEFEKYTNTLTAYTEALRGRSSQARLENLAELRQFDIGILKELGVFYIGDMAEMLLPEYIDKVKELGIISNTNNKPIYSDRYVFPIKAQDGRVLNLVGYSKEAHERYIYGTSKYYDRTNTMYGMENLDYAYEVGWAILTEGITDQVRQRCLGYKNAFSMCGAHGSEVVMRILNRCRYGIIRIPDRDDAGLSALKTWNAYKAVDIFVSARYKDTDEMCVKNPEDAELLKANIDAAAEWLKQSTHKGVKTMYESITIM